jgi:hypothetical protein
MKMVEWRGEIVGQSFQIFNYMNSVALEYRETKKNSDVEKRNYLEIY